MGRPAVAVPDVLPFDHPARSGWTPRELRSLTGISRSSVNRLLTSGAIAGLRVGSSWWVPRQSFEAWQARELANVAKQRRRDLRQRRAAGGVA